MNKPKDFGLNSKTVKSIKLVLEKHSNIKSGIIYGSREKGNYKPGSDIDLVLTGSQLNTTNLLKIENELDDLLLPYKIDLSLYHNIESPDLLEHIKHIGIIFYKNKDYNPSSNF